MTCFLPDELYATNIPGDATEAEVRSLLEQFGKVKEYVVVSKRRDANLSQAALVRMEDHSGAIAVKKALNRIDFKNKQLNLRWSHTQRVIWASNLHESVTNEMLRAAFSQFGSIQRALVVADAQTLATKCFGFVVFENKKDAGRAMAKCVEQPFMIGSSNKPVKVDWARLEDTDQGYSEEVRSGNRGAAANKDLNPKTISRFAVHGTREYQLAVQMAEVDVDYQQMKRAMRCRMEELQEQLMATGHAPSLATCLASDPHFAAIRAAGAPPPQYAPPPTQPQQSMAPPPGPHGPPAQYAPAPGQYAPAAPPYAPPPAQYAPPPGQYAPPPGQYGPGPLPLKRENDQFHHVPPPKRSAMRPKDPDFERFNPEASARAHNPVQGVPAAKPPPNPAPAPAVYKLPPVAPVTSFVKGGQLNTAAALVAVQPPRSDPNAGQQQQQQGQQQEGEAAAASAPGAKPPGQPDFRGIGFTGSAPPPQQHSAAQYAAPQQQYSQYQAPQAPQQQYGQQYGAAPPATGPAQPAYNPYAQQPAPAGQQYSYAPPQQQQQQQQAPAPQQHYMTQQPAPSAYGSAPPQQYGTPQAAPQYAAPGGQYGTPSQYGAPAAYQPAAGPPAQSSPPAMSGYSVGGGQQAYSAGQYAQPTSGQYAPAW